MVLKLNASFDSKNTERNDIISKLISIKNIIQVIDEDHTI